MQICTKFQTHLRAGHEWKWPQEHIKGFEHGPGVSHCHGHRLDPEGGSVRWIKYTAWLWKLKSQPTRDHSEPNQTDGQQRQDIKVVQRILIGSRVIKQYSECPASNPNTQPTRAAIGSRGLVRTCCRQDQLSWSSRGEFKSAVTHKRTKEGQPSWNKRSSTNSQQRQRNYEKEPKRILKVKNTRIKISPNGLQRRMVKTEQRVNELEANPQQEWHREKRLKKSKDQNLGHLWNNIKGWNLWYWGPRGEKSSSWRINDWKLTKCEGKYKFRDSWSPEKLKKGKFKEIQLTHTSQTQAAENQRWRKKSWKLQQKNDTLHTEKSWCDPQIPHFQRTLEGWEQSNRCDVLKAGICGPWILYPE